MLRRFDRYLPIATLPALLLLAYGRIQADPITVTGSYSLQGSNYLYDFAITNHSLTDPDAKLVNVDFPSLPSNSIIGEAVAPKNYGEVTDPSGYVLFDYNLGYFPVGPTIDGFQFVDSLKLTSIAFEAVYLSNDELTLDTFTGTVSPQAPVPTVPEPATVGLVGSASVILLGGFRRLRALRGERQSTSA